MGNAKQTIEMWEVEFVDLNGEEFKLVLDIVDGDEPQLIVYNLLKYSSHLGLTDKLLLVIKTLFLG